MALAPADPPEGETAALAWAPTPTELDVAEVAGAEVAAGAGDDDGGWFVA